MGYSYIYITRQRRQPSVTANRTSEMLDLKMELPKPSGILNMSTPYASIQLARDAELVNALPWLHTIFGLNPRCLGA